MNKAAVPSPPEVLHDLADFTPKLYDAFEGSISIAREFFDNPKHEFDLWYYCGSVRYHVKRLLLAQGFKMEDQNNTGLCLSHGRYRLKMFKTYRGEVPTPGVSKTRQRFYRQIPLPLPALLQMLVDMQGGLVNLLIVWEPKNNHDLARLSLALPKYGSANSATMQWEVAIPHPALSMTPDEVIAVDDDDLGIQRTDEEATGTGDEEPDV
jgi:hypothetical protein